ncbi:glycosyltransferase family 2 protein [Aeromonas jandaei]|uniref:glycosyltransferase family 2 protein n=1 Tax=Aeromonas jandaei TaxID=650 RepID=UPI0038B66402
MIIIPMAGMSSRFFKAGYDKPKYMLSAHGSTLFEHSVNSFKKYFKDTPFLFIVRDVYNTPEFVRDMAVKMGVESFYISILAEETRGQAETVALGLFDMMENHVPLFDGSITIFNIDSFRQNFIFPEVIESCDGYLEVFKGDGDHWSFAKPLKADSTEVIQTAEKKKISDLCSTGLYYFANYKDYIDVYNKYSILPESEWDKSELYIAPLYNLMINDGKKIHYHLIERSEVIFCGVPKEYLDFLEKDVTDEDK